MKIIKTARFVGLVAVLAATGCSDSKTGSEGGEDLSHLTPAEICKQKCDLQAAPQCPKTPPDWATSCAAICEAKYQKYPSCAAQANAVDACSIQKVSYSCDSASGTLLVTPEGACASPGLACASCTGDILQCL